jgi:hypothetical protein
VRWTVFKSRFYGFAAQKYSTKPQLKNCRLARRYTVNFLLVALRVVCAFLAVQFCRLSQITRLAKICGNVVLVYCFNNSCLVGGGSKSVRVGCK